MRNILHLIAGIILMIPALSAEVGPNPTSSATGIQAYQESYLLYWGQNQSGNGYYARVDFTVPAGKMLVIESISANCRTAATEVCEAFLQTGINSVTNETYLPLEPLVVSGVALHRASQNLRAYAKNTHWVLFRRTGSTPVGANAISFSVTGYLVDAIN